MRSGSAVARDVADIVLVDDSFTALLPTQREGRKIINGTAVSMYVFLARVATHGLVIIAVTLLGLGFPTPPRPEQATPQETRAVLAAWAAAGT